MIAKITRAYVRHYSDNGQTVAYVEWIDHKGKKGRSEGNEHGSHMRSLLARATAECRSIEREEW